MGRCDDRGGGLLPSEAPLRVLAAGGNLARLSRDTTCTLSYGKEVHIPRDVPALRESAIPTIFANLPKYMTITLPKERKRRTGQCSSVPAKKSREGIDDSARESVQLTPHDELDIVND
ncbi:hypothetical protein HPB52_008587 [Rhipicephalus sanguineus]|uniref:Uncharacterized protein n=1 Tax=Rhipicephalus sanguineus TaxID=34632 RepID=A0A9D4QAN4_RHISA|nr:hypothetical protein HPB52_008587 [Rhipicephalus sanguineus]